MASGCGSVLRDEGERETKMNLRAGRADGCGSSSGQQRQDDRGMWPAQPGGRR